MGVVVSFMNCKAGVGKTTSVFAIGVMWAKFGKKVLLVDMDPQADLTSILTTKEYIIPYEDGPFMATCFFEGAGPQFKGLEIQHTKYEGLDYVPSGIELSRFDVYDSDVKDSEFRLKELIDRAKKEYDYDYILIDCPPGMSFLAQNCVVAADFIVSVASMSSSGICGMRLAREFCDTYKENKKFKLESQKYVACIVTQFTRTDIKRYESLKREFGFLLMRPRVRKLMEIPKRSEPGNYFIDMEGKPFDDYAEVARDLMLRIKDYTDFEN